MSVTIYQDNKFLHAGMVIDFKRTEQNEIFELEINQTKKFNEHHGRLGNGVPLP